MIAFSLTLQEKHFETLHYHSINKIRIYKNVWPTFLIINIIKMSKIKLNIT